MSKYLKTPDDALTKQVLYISLNDYVLNEHQSAIDFSQFMSSQLYVDDNGEKIIQNIMNNSYHQMRMYGSAKELTENLKIYGDFPFNLEFLEAKGSLFFSSAVIYESLNGEKFISNFDFLTILQNMALKIFPNTDSMDIRFGIMEPLMNRELNNLTSLKFIKFDETIFDEIEKEMSEAAKSCRILQSELNRFGKQFSAGNFTDFIRKTHSKTVKNEVELIGNLKNYYNNLSRNNRKDFCVDAKKMIIVQCLHNTIDERSNLFSGKSVSFVRLFEDGSERFVMKSELFHAISNDVGRKFKDEDHLFTTISIEDVEKIYGHRVKDIEFIRTPINRAKHRSPVVKGHFPGEFGLLAADNLFDLFHDLITSKQLFRRMLYPDWKHISETFEVLFEKSFKPEYKTPYFIRTGSDIPMRFTFPEVANRKDIRNAKIDGFSVQNLKNELVHLGLNRVFPEIGDHAESVYSAVDKIKKGQYLRTCDLFDAVFYCQLICLLDKVPKFKTFLHNQSGCGRVLGYNCEMCQKKKSEIQKTLELSSNESKGIESSENMKKEDTKMISFKEYEEMKMKILELEKENRELKDGKSRSSIQIDNVKMDKLSIDSSIPTVSTNNIISECLICESELKTTGDTLKCPMCRTRFHSKCAMEYVKYGVQCPSCKGTLQNSMAPSKLF